MRIKAMLLAAVMSAGVFAMSATAQTPEPGVKYYGNVGTEASQSAPAPVATSSPATTSTSPMPVPKPIIDKMNTHWVVTAFNGGVDLMGGTGTFVTSNVEFDVSQAGAFNPEDGNFDHFGSVVGLPGVLVLKHDPALLPNEAGDYDGTTGMVATYSVKQKASFGTTAADVYLVIKLKMFLSPDGFSVSGASDTDKKQYSYGTLSKVGYFHSDLWGYAGDACGCGGGKGTPTTTP